MSVMWPIVLLIVSKDPVPLTLGHVVLRVLILSGIWMGMINSHRLVYVCMAA